MDKFQFQAHFEQFKGKLKETFGKLTDDDLLVIKGKKEQLVGKLHEYYGMNKEKVDEHLKAIADAFYSDELRNHWTQIQTKLKQKWNALTEDDIKRIKGKGDVLIAQLQERYHFNREKAEAEFHAFIDSLETVKEKVGVHGKESSM